MTNLFLLIMPLVGGYLFLSYWNVTRYNASRITGYRLFFQSAFVGIILLIFAKPLANILLLFNSINDISEWITPTGFNLESTVAFSMGLVLPHFLNIFFDRQKFARIMAKNQGDSLHLMIYKAIDNRKPIELTMRNRKVYIGLVSIAGDFVNENIIVTPYYSGYRDKETRALIITSNYQDVLAEMKKKEILQKIGIERSDLNVTVRMNDVATAREYYPEVYFEFEKLSMAQVAQVR